MIKSMNRRIKEKISLLGLKMNYKYFIYMRFVTCVILFLFLLFGVDYGYLVSPITTIIYYVFIEYFILDCGIKRRTYYLEQDALEFFPLFLLSLKSGRNIKRAIKTSTDIVDNELAKEFKQVLRTIEMGKSLDEALDDVKKRIPSTIINNIIISLMEANRMGNSLNKTINIQLSYIKERQKKENLSKYKTVSLKLTLISISFVFIIILLLMVFNYYL